MPKLATGCTASTSVNSIADDAGIGNWGADSTDWMPAWQ